MNKLIMMIGAAVAAAFVTMPALADVVSYWDFSSDPPAASSMPRLPSFNQSADVPHSPHHASSGKCKPSAYIQYPPPQGLTDAL